MTALYNFVPPDVEEFTIAWLAPLGPAGAERPAGAALPYRMVNRITGADDLISDDPVISVHTFGASRAAAKTAAKITHRRMLLLAYDPMNDVTLAGSVLANCEYLETVEGPRWEFYQDNTIWRYVARYRLGLKFVAA